MLTYHITFKWYAHQAQEIALSYEKRTFALACKCIARVSRRNILSNKFQVWTQNVSCEINLLQRVLAVRNILYRFQIGAALVRWRNIVVHFRQQVCHSAHE